jgi:hypothetical protein
MSIMTRGLIPAASAFGLALALLAMPARAEEDSFFTHLHAEKAMANVTVAGRAGPVEIEIQLEDANEAPLTADAVSVTLGNAEEWRCARHGEGRADRRRSLDGADVGAEGRTLVAGARNRDHGERHG